MTNLPYCKSDFFFSLEKLITNNQINLIVNCIFFRIGQGGFGFIYKAIKIDTEEIVAIKFERKIEHSNIKLQIEAHLINLLKDYEGFPKLIKYQNIIL